MVYVYVVIDKRYRSPWKAIRRCRTPGGRACLALSLIAALSRSEFVHCSVAVGDDAFDASLQRDLVWARSQLEDRMRGRAIRFEFDPVEAGSFWFASGPCRKSAVATFANWMSLGLYPADNCVRRVRLVLRGFAVDMPRRVTTPAMVYDWARSQGWHQTEL